MLKEDYTEANKAKEPFKFTYTKPSLDWYEDVNVSIAYDEYNHLALERRFGGSWWVIGKKYSEDKNEWVSKQIGEIREKDIPRLVEWAEYTNRFGHQVSILDEVKAIDGCLNPIREFLRIMSGYKAESEEQEISKTIQRPLACRNAHCGAMCSPADASVLGGNPGKCFMYERRDDLYRKTDIPDKYKSEGDSE